MEGYLYIEQELDGHLCDIWLQRYVQSFSFVGIKWFDPLHPLVDAKNQLDKLQARDEDCDWICGGNILLTIPEDVNAKFRSNCKLKMGKDASSRTNKPYDTKALYTFQVHVVDSSNPASRLTISIGCETEGERDLWLREFRETEMRQTYLRSCQFLPERQYQQSDVMIS